MTCCVWRREDEFPQGLQGQVPSAPAIGQVSTSSPSHPFSWGLDFPQACLLHHILKAAVLELGKEMKRTLWWLLPGHMDLQEQGISLHELF